MSKQNSIQTFLGLFHSSENRQSKKTCFLYSPERSILASSPVDRFMSQDDIEGFKDFVAKHKGKQLIGYLSYDLAYQLYGVEQSAVNDLKLPNICFYAYEEWEEFLDNAIPEIQLPAHDSQNFQSRIAPHDYKENFQKIQNYLREGDVYQLNYTHRMEGETTLPAHLLFVKTLEQNPVEFAAYIEGEDFEVLSASPERFIRIQGDKIETFPIKGTVPRGQTPEEDESMKKQLIDSKKEEAELNMITDLLRNDMGKVCKIGTVKVTAHRILKRYSSVWHTHSHIIGTLAVSPIEALLSMSPGGSITGCPKKRAIEIIDELEPTTRGIYTGQIGHIEANGDLDFSIAIRTIIKKGDKLYLQVGGGIVIDSKEEEEYQETLNKAASFMKILS